MRCPSCDHENPAEASFCMRCGVRIESACPSCGKPNLSEASFCISCGARLTQESPGTRSPTPSPSPALPASFAGGRYLVKGFLGEGGRKKVYLAHDEKLDRDVAVTGRCLQGLAEVAERRGERAEALKLLDRAAGLFQQYGARLYLDRVIARKLELQGISSIDAHTSIDRVTASVERERPAISVHPAPDGTVTIMFSDIEGSTEKTDRLGDKAWMEVLREHNAIIREQIKSHGGFEVKSEGDGFMVAFQSAGKALACAATIQKALLARNDSAAEPVKVRMGLHAGEVIKEGEDFFGRNVILAARIASQAKGGEILVSGQLKALVDSAGDFFWGESRDVELKGLSGKHELFEVRW